MAATPKPVVSVRLPQARIDFARAYAARNDISVTDVFRRALSLLEYVDTAPVKMTEPTASSSAIVLMRLESSR